MTFATPWSRPDVPGLVCPPPEQTHVQQHFKDECDIHNILRRIENGGDPAVLQARKGFYADLTEIPVDSLSDAYDAVETAEAAFDALPSDVRSRFNNDPYEFVQFCDNASPAEVAALFGEKAVPTEPERQNATTNNDDANQSGGETA